MQKGELFQKLGALDAFGRRRGARGAGPTFERGSLGD